MAIYLTGGGDQETFSRLDKLYIESLPKGARIALLAHATDDEDEALDRIEHHFSNSKISSIELVQDPSESLLEYDALMIEGGNTFKLIQEIRESAFFDLIKKFFNQGKPIYADSAGAIILGSDVHTAFLGDDGDEDEHKLQDYRGLDIIHPWCIHAHATTDDFEQLTDVLYDTGNPILALSEETGVIISESRIQVFGTESLYAITFSGAKLIAPGEGVDLQLLQE